MDKQRGKHRPKLNMYESAVFAIRIQGEIGEDWSRYFGAQSMSVELDEDGLPVTILISEPVDQAAFIGMINRLNSMALPVISIEHVTVDMSGDLIENDEAIVRMLVAQQ